MKNNFLLAVLLLSQLVAQANPDLHFKGGGRTFLFQPIFAEDTMRSQKISLFNQEIKMDVFQGYAVVRANYWFNNESDKTISMLVGFPYCKNMDDDCTVLYWLRIMLSNSAPNAAAVLMNDSLIRINPFQQKASPDKILNGEKYSEWQTWMISLQPGVTEVALNYGVKTGDALLLANNDSVSGNAMRYSFTNHRWWRTTAMKGALWMRMNAGYTTKDILGLLPDKKFLAGNAVVYTEVRDVMNDSTEETLLWYRNLDSSKAILSHVNWEKQFYKVNGWKVNEKILSTLAPFSATDFEGKAFLHEMETSSSLLRWSWIAGIAIVVIFLGGFIYAEKRKKI